LLLLKVLVRHESVVLGMVLLRLILILGGIVVVVMLRGDTGGPRSSQKAGRQI
jgi:hypothetical protein